MAWFVLSVEPEPRSWPGNLSRAWTLAGKRPLRGQQLEAATGGPHPGRIDGASEPHGGRNAQSGPKISAMASNLARAETIGECPA